MQAALIDVIMSAYNAEATIKSAIASIQVQTVSNIRIIVVDDGSTDATPAILKEIASADQRVQLVFQNNTGIASAVNAGLKLCGAAFIARHDADDISYPDRFQKQYDYFLANPDCIAISGLARHVDALGVPIGTISTQKTPEQANLAYFPVLEPYLLQPMLMIRAKILKELGGYRYLPVSEDSDLYWRLQEIGRLHNMSEIVGDYRMHAGSISSQSIELGRLLAYCSQMSGLSAKRRRSGLRDLDFLEDDTHRLRSLKTLNEFTSFPMGQLNATEASMLALAMSTKIVELAFYRPFELDSSDCRFIRRSLAQNGHLMSVPNKKVFHEHLISTSVRLLIKGHFRSVVYLLPPGHYVTLLVRMAFRVGVPNWLKDASKRAAGRTHLPTRSAYT